MELEEEFEARYAEPGEGPIGWTSDYPIWRDEDPGWVDAYEL